MVVVNTKSLLGTRSGSVDGVLETFNSLIEKFYVGNNMANTVNGEIVRSLNCLVNGYFEDDNMFYLNDGLNVLMSHMSYLLATIPEVKELVFPKPEFTNAKIHGSGGSWASAEGEDNYIDFLTELIKLIDVVLTSDRYVGDINYINSEEYELAWVVGKISNGERMMMHFGWPSEHKV